MGNGSATETTIVRLYSLLLTLSDLHPGIPVRLYAGTDGREYKTRQDVENQVTVDLLSRELHDWLVEYEAAGHSLNALHADAKKLADERSAKIKSIGVDTPPNP